MSTNDALGGRRLAASALAAAAEWLIEPAEENEPERTPAPLEARPVVAVIGLAPRCGATTVARALGAQLAARDPGGACAVTSVAPAGAVALGLPSAARLARTLSPLVGSRARACGRLCLVERPDPTSLAGAARYLAPLVVDVDEVADASTAAALADHLVLVASPSTEPALAAVLAQSLRRVGPDPLTVLNRAGRDCERWAGRGAIALPEARMGAQLALAGREPLGGLGSAIAELSATCRQVR